MGKKIKILNWKFPPIDASKKRLQEAGVNQFEEFPSRKSWKKAILENRVLVNDKIGETSTWISIGDEIEILDKKFKSNQSIKSHSNQAIKIEICYEDNSLLIAVKPCGVSTSNLSKQSLNSILSKQLKNSDIHPAHRLDKDTHGLVIFYKNHKASIWLEKRFRERQIKKEYYALIEGELLGDTIEINTLLNGKKSHSIINKIGTINWPLHNKATFVKVTPTTGRKHQIRLHLKSIGHPIVGDAIYNFGIRFKGQGMFLSCTNLNFTNIETGKVIDVETSLPKKFNRVLRKLDLP